ncbi:MAG: neutral zinc metallopeptidase [Parvularcula sp.]|jgi:predicted metalloprotease|nr:neutral zinc metallopeptidase [Parvularcula sp.]
MRLDDFGRSDNVRDRRGEGGPALGGGGGAMLLILFRFIFSRFGIVGVLVAGAALFLFSNLGINPLSSGAGPSTGAADTRYDQLVGGVLLSTERVFTDVFEEENLGDYPEPTLNLFSGRVTTRGCGAASSAVGPFYCPADREIYLDTNFFDELSRRFGAPGDFAQAYVIAHEVGHHIQTVTGISQQVSQAQSQARSQAEANEYSVRLELMADCFAGVWAKRTEIPLDRGDIDEALRAASAIGDDTLQRQSQGRVVPDSFTHGTSEQRRRWFAAGYQAGEMGACDTLDARSL